MFVENKPVVVLLEVMKRCREQTTLSESECWLYCSTSSRVISCVVPLYFVFLLLTEVICFLSRVNVTQIGRSGLELTYERYEVL